MASSDYVLAGQKLSNNDAMLNTKYESLVKETRLAGGSLVRYKIGIRKHWLFRYADIWGHSGQQYDGGAGRNDLLALWQADTTMTLLEPNDQGAQTSYTVRFAAGSWNETLRFRSPSGDVFRWALAFELMEV